MTRNNSAGGSPANDDNNDVDDGDVVWVTVALHRRTCQERRVFGATPRQVYAHLLQEANETITLLTTVQSNLAHCCLDDRDSSLGHGLLAISPTQGPTSSSTTEHPTSSSSTFSFLSPTKQKSQPTIKNHTNSSHNDDDDDSPSRWLVPHVVPLLDSSGGTTFMNSLQTKQEHDDDDQAPSQPTVYYRMASASWGLTKRTVGVLGKWVLGDDEDEDLVATNVTDLTYTPPPPTSIPSATRSLDADTVVWNIGWIVECCQCILHYAHAYSQISRHNNNDDSFYCVDRHDKMGGSGPVILLDRHGTGPDSFREFCRAAAAHPPASPSGGTSSTMTERTMPWQHVDLLAILLVASRHNVTLLENGTILAFSGGNRQEHNDLNNSSRQVYVALFQLHQTKMALSRRRVGLEQKVAHQTKRALEERKKGRTKSALHYLRFRKQLEHELDTCASLEVSVECHVGTLEQTQTQHQVVHALTHMRSAMTTLRQQQQQQLDHMDMDDVHQLLDNIRHDTDQIDAVSQALSSTHIHHVDDTQELELELQQLLQEEEEEVATTTTTTTTVPPFPQTTTSTNPDDKEPIQTNDTILLPEQSPAESSMERTTPTSMKEPMAA